MTNKGFTLIEVIIYIALFSLLMGTAFVTAYQLIDGARKINSKTTIEEEGNFVSRKLNWTLTSLDPSITPVVGGSLPCSQTLSVGKVNFSSNPILISRNTTNDSVEMKEGAGLSRPLTTSNVKVTCLQFRLISAIGTGPSGIAATTTINGIDFVMYRYFRK